MNNMILIGLRLTPSQRDALDRLVRLGHYPNRNEAIRIAIRDLIADEQIRELKTMTPGPQE